MLYHLSYRPKIVVCQWGLPHRNRFTTRLGPGTGISPRHGPARHDPSYQASCSGGRPARAHAEPGPHLRLFDTTDRTIAVRHSWFQSAPGSGGWPSGTKRALRIGGAAPGSWRRCVQGTLFLRPVPAGSGRKESTCNQKIDRAKPPGGTRSFPRTRRHPGARQPQHNANRRPLSEVPALTNAAEPASCR